MIQVKTQAQLEKALKKTNNGADELIVCLGGGHFTLWENSTATLRENSTATVMTFVIETSNPRLSNGKAYERSEVEPGDFVFRLCRELGRPLTKVEQAFVKRGAQIKHEDQRTGRTITAYLKVEVCA